ncbi:Uncharacterized protein dnm_000140 [Desulfonema magnum]|uniref:Uncharacterized protein n=2 Tax=Desulfonema magnum TaxID=45655 RepID=A0A975BEG6_9BACT|nr:Uncharacterized protein dnm_000140 [Desulfonema magnum]
MNLVRNSSDIVGVPKKEWRIIVRSIGNAGAGIIRAIRHVSPLSEAGVAALLYQAPSVLFDNLPRDVADQVSEMLCSAGLDCKVEGKDEAFVPGDADHEIALVIRDLSRMASVMQLVMEVLGVSLEKAREILCSSPTVLVGNVSLNTVEAFRRRFTPLGVELDVSRPDTALFDLFLGECSLSDSHRIRQILEELHIPMLETPSGSASQPLLAAGLSKAHADKTWERLRPGNMPVRLINRDFERFDVRLEQARPGPEITEFLISTTSMPENIVPKVLKKTPIVTHQNVPFAKMNEYLEAIVRLGGQASGHLLAFQTFSLCLEKVEDPGTCSRILQALAGLNPETAMKAVRSAHTVEGPLTHPQARWLQWELKQAGTEARMVLR